MDTITTPTVNPTPTAVAEVVDKSRQISQVITNRVIKDIQSKTEMVMRDLHDENIAVNYTPTRPRRSPSLYMALHSNVKVKLKKVYSDQIAQNDSTLKQLRDQTELIESQYSACLANYGIKYEPSRYNNPFTELAKLLVDDQLGEHVAQERCTILTNKISAANEKISAKAFNMGQTIQREAERLNTVDPYQRKNSRIRKLQDFAEVHLTELIRLRDELKKEIQNEYQTYLKERVTKGHEDHGPTAIL